MKNIFLTIFTLFFVSENLYAKINIENTYSCQVKSSNHPTIQNGTKLTPIKLNNFVILNFDTGEAMTFYSNLKPYYDGINDLVLALDANSPREIYVTAFLNEESEDELEMKLSYLHTQRKYPILPNGDIDGDNKFIFTDSIQFSFICKITN